MELKRLFFGMEAIAPWPEQFPPGRVLAESDRHLTLAFLGNVDFSAVEKALSGFPKPPFAVGLAAQFDRPVFLPPRSSRVAAWHIDLLEGKKKFLDYQKSLILWLKERGFHPKDGKFLPHLTMARSPFAVREWKKAFHPLPLYLKNIHLCESLGHSKYLIRWSYPLLAPFDAIEHTADIAFCIRGENFSQIHLHAQLALSFYFPQMIRYFDFSEPVSLEQIVESLNKMIALADMKEGCPFKAVSFHGELTGDPILEWEMIVDV